MLFTIVHYLKAHGRIILNISNNSCPDCLQYGAKPLPNALAARRAGVAYHKHPQSFAVRHNAQSLDDDEAPPPAEEASADSGHEGDTWLI